MGEVFGGVVAFLAVLALLGTAMNYLAPLQTARVLRNMARKRAGLVEKTVEVDGLRFPYLTGGRGAPLVLLHGFTVTPDVFRTAWFLESMVTQILVIFLIRSTLPLWKSRPHRFLVLTSLGALAIAVALALTPLGAPFGFVPPPPAILAAMAVLVVGYLTAAEFAKHAAMRHHRHRA